MNILPGKLFYVNIMTLTAKSVNIPKVMTVASASIGSKCILHSPSEDPCMISSAIPASTQCDVTNRVNDIHYKHLKPRDEQVDIHNAVNESDNNSKTYW